MFLHAQKIKITTRKNYKQLHVPCKTIRLFYPSKKALIMTKVNNRRDQPVRRRPLALSLCVTSEFTYSIKAGIFFVTKKFTST